jgi:hypothetical protein
LVSSPVLTVAEAASVARMSKTQMLRWLRGELGNGTPRLTCALQVGKRWLINREGLERFLTGETSR